VVEVVLPKATQSIPIPFVIIGLILMLKPMIIVIIKNASNFYMKYLGSQTAKTAKY
jgi:hypothetical protein